MKTPPVVFRVSMLRTACRSQQVLFKDTFGKEVVVSVPNLRKACNAGLEIGWLITKYNLPLPWHCGDATCEECEPLDFKKLAASLRATIRKTPKKKGVRP